jgi:TnpA family transposase
MTEETILLSIEEIQICEKKIGSDNQLLFGIMLAYFKINIKFPAGEVSALHLNLVTQVAHTLGIDTVDQSIINSDNRTTERYRKEIRSFLHYREATDRDSPEFIDFLIKDILPKNPANTLLLEQTRLYFVKHKIELFKDKQLKRYIQSAKYQFEQQFYDSICNILSSEDRLLIDQILTESDIAATSKIINLAELKKDIPGARLKHVQNAIDKINLLSKITIPQAVLQNIDRKLLLKYYDRIMALSPSHILEFAINSKYVAMAIFCHIRLQLMLDELVDTFIKLTHRMRTKAAKNVDAYILKEVKRVNGKFDILKKLAIATVNNPTGIIEETVYPEVSREVLLEIINDLQHRGKWYQQQVNTKIQTNYVHGNRKILLSILQLLSLHEDHGTYKPLLKAIKFINKHWQTDSENYKTMPPMDEIIPDSWLNMVSSKQGDKEVVNKYNYEIAVLEKLTCFLGFKAIWVKDSYRYRNPNEDIPQDFKKNKKSYYKLLGLPTNAKTFTKQLKQSLGERLQTLNTNMINNDQVAIKESSSNKNIKVSDSDPQIEPANIEKLHKEITDRWTSINLIDILKECDLLINFSKEMETISSSSKLSSQDLRKRLLLCLYGIGSNTGLKRISIANGDINSSDLRYVKNRFINHTNVRNAIKQVVNNVLAVRDSNIWGEATTTVACDSTQISAWDQNLMNEWHHRYKGKGVMIYWHVDKKALCIYSQLKSCSSSEVGSMIKGIIDHDTKMNMNRIFVDTHGQSVIGFAVSNLLGFDLLPRFKGINKQKLFGVTSKDKKKYANIAEIIQGTINWNLIEDNYDEIVKYMVSLKLGLIEPSVLVKRFSSDNYNHPVYKALLEIGKAEKSIFLCKYLDQEELRIEINEGLNVVERLNSTMDFIFYGKLGELKTNQIQDQELSVLCLHLLQACMVYINTLMIQEVLSQPHWNNVFTTEDYRALTPLISTHINPYGLFPIDFNQRISIYSNQLHQASNVY